jgi:hypothetical protein
MWRRARDEEHMTLSIPAEPYDFTFDPAATALLIIDIAILPES